MSGKIAAILGATGMTGQHLLNQLLEDNFFESIKVIVRRPMEKTHPKMQVKLVDFSDAESLRLALEDVDIIFCCIGTTQKKVKGDKALYRSIDYDIAVNAARFGKEAGCEQYVLMSAVSASVNSSNFYLKLKGEIEEAITVIGFTATHILQPSVLTGKRNEKRLGEEIGRVLGSAVSFLLIGGLQRYKPIKAETVAKAMQAAAKQNAKGVARYRYKEIIKLAATGN